MTVGTPTAWVIIRVLVESKDDLEAARNIQREIHVTARTLHPKTLTERAGRANQIALSGPAIFEEIHRYTLLDPPAEWHPHLSEGAKHIVENPTSISTEVLAKGIQEAEQLLASGNPMTAFWSKVGAPGEERAAQVMTS